MNLARDFRRIAARMGRGAFTLIELLVSMTVVAFIVVMIASLANGTSRIWSGGERTVENNQIGRAVLEIIARELSQAVVSSKLPFVQDPVLGSDAKQRTGTNSIFWVAPLSSTNNGNLCEVGYYLTNTFELKRFFVPPSDTTNYMVLTSTPGSDYTLRPTGNSGNDNDHSKAARWASEFITNKDANQRPVSNTVAGGVLNFFVRCLDINGDPIPWLDTGLKYNSAEPMRPATPGVRNTSGNPSSFTYTYYNASNPSDTQNTVSANLLPYAVELTLVTVDAKTLQRVGASAVPATPPVTATRDSYAPNALPAAPLAVPGNISLFIQNARAAGFRDVRSFSTTVRLRNAAQ